MTIDERLEKLTERHEALAQTVELMVEENRERGRKWEANIAKSEANIAKLTDALDRMVANTEALTRVVRDHERRIHKLKKN